MLETSVCPGCGAPLRGGTAAERLCLACLLAQGLPEKYGRPAWRPDSLAAYLRIVSLVADGPRARVYLAQWASPDGGLSTLKRSHDAVPPDPRRALEVTPLLELDHPHVAAVFDAGRDADGHLYVITEYVPGTPLPEYWRQSGLRQAERLELLRQTADTLAYLHACHIVHANLKPTNVLVLDPPTGVKLLDLEAAMPREPSAGGGVETGFDPDADIRGLGSMLCSMLDEADPGGAGADPELRRIARKAGTPRRGERYGTMLDLAADLARCLAVAAAP